MKVLRLLPLVVLLSLAGTGVAQASPTLLFHNGVFSGVTDFFIPTLGQSYDLTFQTGTCAQVFGVCDQAHFMFTDRQSAVFAVSAFGNLWEANGGPSHSPMLLGCPEFSGCSAVVPYDLSDPSNVLVRQIDMHFHGFDLDGFPTDYTVSANSSLIWLVFKPAGQTAVPEPSTVSTLAIGLAAAALRLRRRRAS